MFLLPLFLALHTFQVVRAFTAPEPEIRQYWVWAWQMSPLWLGLANSLLCSMAGGIPALKNSFLASPRALLAFMCAISSTIWVYTLLYAPFSLSDVFIPDSAVYSDFVGHTRKALQCDEVYSFGSSFLWLLYMFSDMYTAGLIGMGSLVVSCFIPFVAAVAGPGTAFALGWYWRERVLSVSQSL